MMQYPTHTLSATSLTESSPSRFGRWLQVIPLAALITFALLIFMERLIHMTDMVVDEVPALDFGDIHWEEPITEDHIDKKVIERPQEPPEIPEAPTTESEPGGEIEYQLPTNPISVLRDGPLQISMNADMPIPQYLAAPRYPSAAIRRELEGYVDVIFDVTEFGGTDNIRIIAAEPEGVFETAAIAAVKRWRFQPKTVDDKAVYFEGMVRRVRFEMQK